MKGPDKSSNVLTLTKCHAWSKHWCFPGYISQSLVWLFCREAICHQVQQEAHGELRDKRLLLGGRVVEGICLWCVTLNCNTMNFTDKLITVL